MAYVIDPDGVETGVLHDLADFDGARVLEVGCGDGRLTWRFAPKAKSVLAFDLRADEIEMARAATPDALAGTVEFVAADFSHADVPTEAFEVAILSYSL